MFRTVYRHLGEILTLLVFICIGMYLYSSMEDSKTILENEEEARNNIIKIYKQEKSVFDSKKTYASFVNIIQDVPSLGQLVKISEDKSGKSVLYSDQKYIYFFRLEFELNSVDNYISRQEKETPSGYRLMAWPSIYSTTGELVFYIDQEGMLCASANPSAQYDGTKILPPDLKTPASFIDNKDKGETSEMWRIIPL
ncbi:MAG: hypothetical protein ABIK28_19215 [Planctomycetota bacterium]